MQASRCEESRGYDERGEYGERGGEYGERGEARVRPLPSFFFFVFILYLTNYILNAGRGRRGMRGIRLTRGIWRSEGTPLPSFFFLSLLYLTNYIFNAGTGGRGMWGIRRIWLTRGVRLTRGIRWIRRSEGMPSPPFLLLYKLTISL